MMGLQDLFIWRSATVAASMPDVADEDLVADVDEPPEHRHSPQPSGFQKSTVRSQSDRKESLLTRALKTPEPEAPKPELYLPTNLSRRRSMMSNASLSSTAELTSDGGLTSPSRANTPSPPPPNATYTSFAPFSLSRKSIYPIAPTTNVDSKDPTTTDNISVSPKTQVLPDVAPKRRCITFACGARKDPPLRLEAPAVPPPAAVAPTVEAPRRPCTIKFACTAPKPSDRSATHEAPRDTPSKPLEAVRKGYNRSPSLRSPRPGLISSRSHRDSNATVRLASQNPVATRAKPKYIVADEKALPTSDATRFHEFACEELQEDDWIRKESDNPRQKLTISDTLKMENDIRRLGNEAEEEALEDEEDEENDRNGIDSDDDNASDQDDDDEEGDDIDESDDEDASDGNETDNEAGFADSDEESDPDGEFAFWTPGNNVVSVQSGEASTYRASVHRSASASSIDSLNRSVSTKESGGRHRQRHIKIRPGTPDLPDSTDFVCGTIDEDRPLEDAYVSCMEARKNAKHKRTPQDIDPSFPISDIEDEEDEEDDVEPARDSDEHVWLHGKFEDSDDGRHGRRINRRKSPAQSPKRLRSPPPPKRHHSPPPAKARLRSPPPRKLFDHSPKRLRSPPPARMVRSPPASLAIHAAVGFAPLGSRPGLTHTKSLPRAPNAFGRQYQASRMLAANGNADDDDDDTNDAHIRGAIDIVKGLEQKRQRRKEKLYSKQNNRKGKAHTERKPQPGKGAERMRELGLLMAGKTEINDPYILSA